MGNKVNECLNPKCVAKETKVFAAGAVCWRVKDGNLQVLLIHRPNYDDWSIPKGKLDPGETLPQTAVREVWEEVGLKIRLGIPLPPVHYQVKQGYKHISYWAAEATNKVKVDDKEVDKANWYNIDRALRKLTQRVDQKPVAYLAKAFEDNELETWPYIMVRHAKAKPRSAWARAEGDRPLAATGRKQAKAVGPLLESWHPTTLVTSPWLRCYRTLEDYSQKHEIKLKTKSALTEKNHERKPEKVVKVLNKLLEKHEPIAICSHRPVFPTIVDTLRFHADEHAAEYLPTEDPWLKPGEIIVSQVAINKPQKIVSIEMHRPAYDNG
ncbi:MAG: NUDIX hydrolase [Micrococcaceae bacterium]